MQVSILWLQHAFNLQRIACVNTTSGSSVWNPNERLISDLNNALCSASLYRVVTETNIEQEIVWKKSNKALMERNSQKTSRNLVLIR